MLDFLDFQLLALFAVGVLSGSLNAVAGGGSFFSFPVFLSVGLPPVLAQGSNHLGLLPANMLALLPFVERIKQLRWRLLRAILLCGGAGICGGLALVLFPPVVFENIVPYLILMATGLFWLQPRLKALLDRVTDFNLHSSLFIVKSVQVLVAFYCGYFGAGVGFLFLLAFALDGFDDMVDTQCMKNTVVSLISFFVLLVFIAYGNISWGHALPVFCGAALGGFFGGQLIAHVPAKLLRSLIIAVGLGLFVGYLYFY